MKVDFGGADQASRVDVDVLSIVMMILFCSDTAPNCVYTTLIIKSLLEMQHAFSRKKSPGSNMECQTIANSMKW